jgi:hypothetical protein|tara:strand:- start:173 stop:598 length:426 start_codon:yes stop_codon:yes gene_type:complete
MKKIILAILFVSCSSTSLEEVVVTTSIVPEVELTICEKVEKEYVNLSNDLFNAGSNLNEYISNLSDRMLEENRNIFFKDIDENINHQNIYKEYLQVRASVYQQINSLYKINTDCSIAGDQEISNNKVLEAKKELSDFLYNY